MIEDRTSDIAAAAGRLTRIGEYLHLDAKSAEADALEATANEPGFWDDPSSAQATMSKAAELRSEIGSVESVRATLEDAVSVGSVVRAVALLVLLPTNSATSR